MVAAGSVEAHGGVVLVAEFGDARVGRRKQDHLASRRHLAGGLEEDGGHVRLVGREEMENLRVVVQRLRGRGREERPATAGSSGR